MDLQALKDLRAKVDPAAAKKTVTYDQVLVKAADLSSVPEVESQIKALGYETSSYEDMRKSLEEQSRAIQLILGGIGAVSLLVAAIARYAVPPVWQIAVTIALPGMGRRWTGPARR